MPFAHEQVDRGFSSGCNSVKGQHAGESSRVADLPGAVTEVFVDLRRSSACGRILLIWNYLWNDDHDIL